MENKSKTIILPSDVNEVDIENFLNEIKKLEGKFGMYDPFYPSPSDPGAYISYANYNSRNDQWQMTLGNHGWSGGIYLIKNEIIVQQLKNIAFKQGSVEVVVRGVTFFSHYPIESKEKIKAMNSKLEKLHCLNVSITSRSSITTFGGWTVFKSRFCGLLRKVFHKTTT